MTKYFADVSNYQRDDLAFFQDFVNAGVESTMILATEGSANGTAFVNPKLLNQTRNALKAGMNVGFYHYFLAISDQDAIDEAKFFESKVVELGFGKDTPLCVDVEDPSLNTSEVASYVDSFINYLKTQGYTNVFQYSMASWFGDVLNANAHRTWVASYGSSDCGARGNIIAWQYTSKWGGGSQDMSIDWGVFDKVAAPNPVEKPVKSTIVNVVKALSGAVKGYTTYNSKGIADKDTNIAPDSLWKSNNIVVIGNKAYFQIATDTLFATRGYNIKR
jgi:Lyzozyme M1 (1,4-beta-N-acetylmuramidase)